MYFGLQQVNHEYAALKEMAASVDWPSTECIVKTSKKDIQVVRVRTAKPVYAPVIVYSYNVDGKQRLDNRISFGEARSMRCYNLDCRATTSGRAGNSNSVTNIDVAAHTLFVNSSRRA